MSYDGSDMIGDDGYGTWDAERLDKEYRNLRQTIKKMLAVKKTADSGTALSSCQGQAMDGYSELANYRAILEEFGE